MPAIRLTTSARRPSPTSSACAACGRKTLLVNVAEYDIYEPKKTDDRERENMAKTIIALAGLAGAAADGEPLAQHRHGAALTDRG